MQSFLHIDIGNLGTWVLILFAILGFARKLGKLEAAIAIGASDLIELTKQVEGIDRHGTRFSQKGLTLESELTKSNSRRLDSLDSIKPDIATLTTNVEWIKKSLETTRIGAVVGVN